MRRKLVVRPAAEFDIIHHSVFLIERRASNAGEFRTAVRAACSAARNDPRSCAVLDRHVLPDLDLRFCKPQDFRNYLVIFQVNDDSVVILRVLHASQDIDAALKS
jgi:plasmid stabilization system protein ParE